MAERRPIGKKMRFEVFKRDSFRCQYCGRSAPDVILEVDHMVSIADGGKNTLGNLVTSCRDCNRGKGKTSIVSKALANAWTIKPKQNIMSRTAKTAEKKTMFEAPNTKELIDLIFPKKEVNPAYKLTPEEESAFKTVMHIAYNEKEQAKQKNNASFVCAKCRKQLPKGYWRVDGETYCDVHAPHRKTTLMKTAMEKMRHWSDQ